jgi:AraC-like DNA-binding protein
MTCELNMEQVEIGTGDSFCVSRLVQSRELSCSPDLTVRLLVMNHDFIDGCTQGVGADDLQALFASLVMPLAEARLVRMMDLMLDLLQTYSDVPDEYNDRQISASIVRSMILMLVKRNEYVRQTLVMPQFTTADSYFRRFINLVSENVATEHEVAFYATHLSITPKYLSEICKTKTGRKAKEIISALLLRAIKSDLLNTGKSMKDLAAEYGFADQSSLGKFFRKMTGLSPLHYRQHENSLK